MIAVDRCKDQRHYTGLQVNQGPRRAAGLRRIHPDDHRLLGGFFHALTRRSR
ncbi:MAG: hypothetical protein MZV70_74915 [Desulfobacterales bacterium]|nr:hypothetical protein [Desulfobacterales bacterium]